jgi:hypothetical protein
MTRSVSKFRTRERPDPNIKRPQYPGRSPNSEPRRSENILAPCHEEQFVLVDRLQVTVVLFRRDELVRYDETNVILPVLLLNNFLREEKNTFSERDEESLFMPWTAT